MALNMSDLYKSAGTHEASVDNMSLMIRLFPHDALPFQFFRELTKNCIQAGATDLVIDVDWDLHRSSKQRLFKLCWVDNGKGMNRAELARYTREFYSSDKRQAMDGNFGIGGRASTAALNELGVVYESWTRDSVGSLAILRFDEKRQVFGLVEWTLADGTVVDVKPLEAKERSAMIPKEGGTKVTLLGNSEDEQTALPLQGQAAPARWLSRVHNDRFLEVPAHVQVRIFEGFKTEQLAKGIFPTRPRGRHHGLRRAHGQRYFLDKFSSPSGRGTVALAGGKGLPPATAHYWVIDDLQLASKDNESYLRGQFAFLHDGEMYGVLRGVAGYARLQELGVSLGGTKVVILLEPAGPMETNSARSELLLPGGHAIDHSLWAAQFVQQLPAAIKALVEAELGKGRNQNASKKIEERIAKNAAYWGCESYVKTLAGTMPLQAAKPPQTTGAKGAGTASKTGKTGKAGKPRTRKPGAGNGLGGPPSPPVAWVHESSNPLLKDRAAQFDKTAFVIYANIDFRGYKTVAAKICEHYGVPYPNPLVREAVETWFGAQLAGSVVGVLALKFSAADEKEALSPLALTTAVRNLPPVIHDVKRQVGHALKRAQAAGLAAAALPLPASATPAAAASSNVIPLKLALAS